MSNSRIVTILSFLTLSLLSSGRTFEELKVSFEVKMLSIKKDHANSLAKLQAGYLAALDRVQKKLEASGRLDDVIAVQGEKKRIQSAVWPLPSLKKNSPIALLEIRKKFETTKIKLNRENASGIVDVSEKMGVLLDAQIKSLTRSGEIQKAKKAQDFMKALAMDQDLLEAKNFLQRVRLDSDSPVAFRIRRTGDNVEVLVRYDRNGKLSLESPVENVVEITGGKKQKGETKAKNLGQFVGAKGYEAATYIAYENDMDDSLLPPMAAISLEAKPGVTFEERKCLRFKMGTKAPNPRIEWPQLLSPLLANSKVRLEFAYFIPKENKKLLAFAFHQGVQAPLNSQILDQRGRWVEKSIEAEAVNDNANLRLYVENLSGGGRVFDGANEVMYLDDLKVTFLSFSAFVVEKYNNGKMSDEPILNAEAQKALVVGGELVSQN